MSHRVLIVEDEAIVALDLQTQLQDLGYPVVGVAASAARALELAHGERPDVVLMDVRIDGPRDGIEAADRIGREHGTPVIFLTAHNDHETVRRAVATAPYGFLTKPFQIQELRAAIEVALARVARERALTLAGPDPATAAQATGAAAPPRADVAAAQARGEARARLSHEMRTPLNAVIGFAQLLQLDASGGDPHRREYVRHIETAGRHLLALVDDELDLERNPLRLGPVDMAALLREVAAALQATALAQHVSIDCPCAGPVTARADAARLRQALLCLVGNAIKFNRAGGRVMLVAAADTGGIAVTIADDGIGMTPAQQARLTEPVAAPSDTAAGSLGFSTARSLVEAMAGSVSVTSEARAGTRVTLRLLAA